MTAVVGVAQVMPTQQCCSRKWLTYGRIAAF